jgi:DnaJ like chaperone protein
MWGKVIFGGVGAMIGGPIGAGIGVAIGETLFDSSNNKTAPETEQPKEEDVVRLTYFYCIFASIAKLAKADGHISQHEIEAIEAQIQYMDLDEEMRAFAIDVFREAKDDDEDIIAYLDQFAAIIQYDQQLGLSFLEILYTISVADGDVSLPERQILIAAEKALQLPAGTIGIRFKAIDDLEKAYALLGCDKSMATNEIKQIYRKKCMDFHPDKLSSRGLPTEFMKFANDQMVKIHEAYETICESRKHECVV